MSYILQEMQKRWCDDLHALYELAIDIQDDASRDMIIAHAIGIEHCDMDLRAARRTIFLKSRSLSGRYSR
jgi:hypothetical protein